MAYLLLLYKSGGDYPNGTIFWPEVGYTLVSIGRLDECGYLTTFGNGQCTISNKSSNIIGQVPALRKQSTRWSMTDQNLPAWLKIQSFGLNSTTDWVMSHRELPSSWQKRALLLECVETEYCEMLFQVETERSDKELYQIIAQSRPVQMISY